MKKETPTKIDNLKMLINQLESKKDFVEKVAAHYKMSYIYLLQNWFQSKWTVPTDKLDEIIEMAQTEIFEQTNRKQKLLLDTGFKNK